MVNIKINPCVFSGSIIKTQEGLSIEVPHDTTLLQIRKIIESWLSEKKRDPERQIQKIELLLVSIVRDDGQNLYRRGQACSIREECFNQLMRQNPLCVELEMQLAPLAPTFSL
ncbi:MAG: hypothetical protein RLZZ453_350 [Chlamydiota bacterium]|jgi:hypothetical protein